MYIEFAARDRNSEVKASRVGYRAHKLHRVMCFFSTADWGSRCRNSMAQYASTIFFLGGGVVYLDVMAIFPTALSDICQKMDSDLLLSSVILSSIYAIIATYRNGQCSTCRTQNKMVYMITSVT